MEEYIIHPKLLRKYYYIIDSLDRHEWNKENVSKFIEECVEDNGLPQFRMMNENDILAICVDKERPDNAEIFEGPPEEEKDIIEHNPFEWEYFVDKYAPNLEYDRKRLEEIRENMKHPENAFFDIRRKSYFYGEEIKENVDGVDVKLVDRSEIRYNGDTDEFIKEPEYEVVANYKGKTYKFKARNIFDFGLAINPTGGEAAHGYKGGLPLNVEGFIEANPTAFKDEKRREEFIKEHPTKTGWGWDRWIIAEDYGGPEWIPMDEEEVHVLKTVEKALPSLMHSIRM